MDLNGFDWGTSNSWFIETISKEIFEEKIYEKFFEVENGDIVIDVGASIGPFTYSILNKNPKHVICVEPSFEEFPVLIQNTRQGNVSYLNKAINNFTGEFISSNLFGFENGISSKAYGITFKDFINLYNLEKIDFLKTDSEAGEYDIFNLENLEWVKNNVKKIVGEWHLGNFERKQKFRQFRDLYLKEFSNYEVHSVNGVNIKWDLWNEHFIEFYSEIVIYIDNR
jgi:FkbM family methyltransferase